MYNKAVLIGNLGRDPEVRYLPSGSAVCEFNVATTRRKGAGENAQNVTDWHNITVFGKTAENCGQYLKKGSRVMVEGPIVTESWEGNDGKKHYKTKILANIVKFLDKREAASERDDEPVPF